MSRPTVGLACSNSVRRRYIGAADLARLTEFAEFEYRPFELRSGLLAPPPYDAAAEREVGEFVQSLDALLVCHGAPRITADLFGPNLRLIGELEGDRFGYRVDVAAAQQHGIRVLDTSHGSSMGVAEWALGLALIGLRDAGARFRKFIGHEHSPGGEAGNRELTGRPVSLIGFGHIGRRLMELLRPFGVDALVYDPYVPREMAAAYGIAFADLPTVIRHGDVVFCLLPLTPSTEKMLGADQLELLRSGAVFVNVSRGAVVDSAALLDRLARGDVIGCLDVFDPEPIPTDSLVRDLPNVFLSPHIAGVTGESRTHFFRFMVDELQLFFTGRETTADLTETVVDRRHGRFGA